MALYNFTLRKQCVFSIWLGLISRDDTSGSNGSKQHSISQNHKFLIGNVLSIACFTVQWPSHQLVSYGRHLRSEINHRDPQKERCLRRRGCGVFSGSSYYPLRQGVIPTNWLDGSHLDRGPPSLVTAVPEWFLHIIFKLYQNRLRLQQIQARYLKRAEQYSA